MSPYSYQMHEMAYLALAPARAMSDMTRLWFKNPINPLSHTTMGRNMAATAELFERLTRRYAKPVFGIETATIAGEKIPIVETVVWQRPFCRLVNFHRDIRGDGLRQPKLLIVAPMSGHFAT